jgi:hypothetical protein
LSSRPERIADIGVGPSEWASGSQLCSGTSPTLVPYPTSRNTNDSVSTVGSNCPADAYSTFHSSASSRLGITRSAAKNSSTVPNKACAMPTPQRMKYFHAASTASGVR